ncbi:hypothetical protein D1P53_003655 [Cryptococcus gattii VGV]|nr:hypothetical protein D1P53_003655 [Cryptococcus gattii VGV]
MAPLDLGNVGDAIQGAGQSAVNGAQGVVASGAGAVATVTDKAAGAVASATAIAGDVANGASQAAGLLKWMKTIQDWITKIEDYWNEYKNLIIFNAHISVRDGVGAIEAPVSAIANRAAMRLEGKIITSARGAACIQSPGGWWDPTYFARAGGRYELPEDPVERAKWHWWGHEEGWVHKGVELTLQCLGTTVDKEKRLMKELSSAAGRDEHFTKLSQQMSRAGGRLREEGEDLKERINRQWAERKGLVHELNKKLTKAEKRMVDRAQSRLEKKMQSEHWNSDDSDNEDEKPRTRDTGGKI